MSWLKMLLHAKKFSQKNFLGIFLFLIIPVVGFAAEGDTNQEEMANALRVPAENRLTDEILNSASTTALKESTSTAVPVEQPKESSSPKTSVPPTPIEINGDQVQFIMERNAMQATGNVSIVQGVTKLTCDRVEFSRDTKIAVADGHVVLTSPKGIISGDKMTYNFDEMSGNLENAKIITMMENQVEAPKVVLPGQAIEEYPAPSNVTMYGVAKSVAKVGENQITMRRGDITTCDLAKPHYYLRSKKIDIFPKDKIVARNMKMYVGRVPIMYIPKMTQEMDGKPRVQYIPGYSKLWGAYLLQLWRFTLNDNVKGILHLDYRERKAFAPGADVAYTSKNMGEGSVRLYYMNELTPGYRHFWQASSYGSNPSKVKTIYRERFRAEWRHKWRIDETADMTLQYSKLSDDGILRDYSKREFQKDSSPQTFFLLTKALTNGIASFRLDGRVNRFAAGIERLPEIKYDASSIPLPKGFYFSTENTFSNLASKQASPTEVRLETMRMDSLNQISYPMKVGFVEMKPFVGQRETYYSKTKDTSKYDVTRSIFLTGATLSTNFYRVLDIHGKLFGEEFHRLRHVVTPQVDYTYQHTPTIPSSLLDTYDGVDSLGRMHTILFSLINKIQTKREGRSADLARATLSAPFNLKENPGKGGFDHIKTDFEVTPLSWVRFLADTDYDSKDHRLTAANYDIYLHNKGSPWYVLFGQRYSPNVDDQITVEFGYRINPKWRFNVYRRFDLAHGTTKGSLKEEEYILSRDLHCWEMDLDYRVKPGEGSEILLVFRLKAFPDIGFDFGSGFNKRKAGSQEAPPPPLSP